MMTMQRIRKIEMVMLQNLVKCSRLLEPTVQSSKLSHLSILLIPRAALNIVMIIDPQKMNGETPKVSSDKKKPREEREELGEREVRIDYLSGSLDIVSLILKQVFDDDGVEPFSSFVN